MKLKLIFPRRKAQDFLDWKGTRLFKTDRTWGLPLALPTIAALTPSDVDVGIIDENVEPINFDEDIDMVGISFFTAFAPRAYGIADTFRSKGVTVVLGGIHASMLPEEAIQHADAVVIGEAENVWVELINDFRKGRLRRFYSSSQKPNLKNSPIPRWDLSKPHLYNFHILQASRGCPFDCEFCSVKAFLGKKCRCKPVEKVIEEIRTLKQIDSHKVLFFADDNILCNIEYARELFEAITPLKVRWFCQAPINIAKDEELLSLMYESGCRQVFIGFESLSQKSLNLMNKGRINKVEDYMRSVDVIHSHGISVFGSFMLGNDFDDETIFEKTVSFIMDANIAFSLIAIVTPLPGTRFYQRLEKEGRLIHKRWEEYSGQAVCFEPRFMSPERLLHGWNWVLQRIYSYDALYERLSNLWSKGILVKSEKSIADLFASKRVILTLESLLSLDTKEAGFMLKSLWKPKVAAISPLLMGLSFHKYSFDFPDVSSRDTS